MVPATPPATISPATRSSWRERTRIWPLPSSLRVLDDQAPPTTDVLLKHATELGLNLKDFQACINSGKYARVILADRSSAFAAGIHGTPAFVIGRVDGGWINGVAVQGARPFPFFQRVIDEALNAPLAEPAKANPAGMVSPSQGSGSERKR